jgi:hypothetical protein
VKGTCRGPGPGHGPQRLWLWPRLWPWFLQAMAHKGFGSGLGPGPGPERTWFWLLSPWPLKASALALPLPKGLTRPTRPYNAFRDLSSKIGPILGPSWPFLGPMEAQKEPKKTTKEPKKAQQEPKKTHLGAHEGASQRLYLKPVFECLNRKSSTVRLGPIYTPKNESQGQVLQGLLGQL